MKLNQFITSCSEWMLRVCC